MCCSEPLLFFNFLADRQLNPGAIELNPGQCEAHGLSYLIADDRFCALAAAIPCLVGDELAQRLPAELLQGLQDAGCRMIANKATHRSDAMTRPVLPPGADWLAGDWYLAPPPRASGSHSVSRALSLKLMQKVASDADTWEIEAIFRQGPVLAYHLLRLVNSPGVGVGRPISSFAQAILVLGRQQLKRWLNLMLFAANGDDYRSAMLLAQVAVRARSMELLARACGLDRAAQEHAFMAGMFSLLGVLFGLPLPEVLKPLKLSDSLTDAVLRQAGDLGLLMHAVQCAERADDAGLRASLGALKLSIADYNSLNIDAYLWMQDIIRDQRDGENA